MPIVCIMQAVGFGVNMIHYIEHDKIYTMDYDVDCKLLPISPDTYGAIAINSKTHRVSISAYDEDRCKELGEIIPFLLYLEDSIRNGEVL